MPSNARIKRTTKPTATTPGLLYTTYEFIQRLRARGRALRFDVRDLLLQWVQLHTDQGGSANSLWNPECPELQRHLSTVAPVADTEAVIPLLRLCTLLAPLDAYELQYLNLVIVLHSLTTMEIKNLYRYCYLEWLSSCSNHTSVNPWTHTPREFSTLNGHALSVAWDGVLVSVLSSPSESERASRGLFFVNRLYAYLTPCG